jgi:uncharacterized protein (DUF2249 family)
MENGDIPEPAASTERIIDVLDIPPRVRHEVIFQLFQALVPESGFQIVVDHDPRPLRYQFQAEFGDQVVWTYLEAGPDRWRVRIGRA